MKTVRRILALVLIMVVALTAVPLTAGADSIEDTAVAITSGNTYSHIFAGVYGEESADYKIVAKSNGTISVKVNSTTEYIALELYDSNFNTVKVANSLITTGSDKWGGIGKSYISYQWNPTGEKIVATTTWNVNKGTYYLRVGNRYYDSNSSGVTRSGTAKITVTCPSVTATKAKISYLSLTMSKGTTIQLGAVVSPSNSKVTWTSSKTSVATVSTSGKITAKAKGTTLITAKCGSSIQRIRIVVK